MPTRASRPALTRQRVIEVALDLLEREGHQALSLRRLAAELGVGTMTLYTYFRSKEELLDGVIDSATRGTVIPSGDGGWKDQLRALMTAMHRQLWEHRFLVELRRQRPLLSPGALRWTERGLAILQAAGFDPAQSGRAFRPLFLFTFGHAAFQPRWDDDGSIRRASHGALVALPPERYPAVLAAGRSLADTMVGEDAFAYGLEVLLNGLERDLERSRGAGTGSAPS